MSNIQYYNKTENCKIKWLWWAERTALISIIYHWAYIMIDYIEFFKVTGIDWIIPLGIHVQYAFVYLLEISLNFGTNAAVRMFSGNSRR